MSCQLFSEVLRHQPGCQAFHRPAAQACTHWLTTPTGPTYRLPSSGSHANHPSSIGGSLKHLISKRAFEKAITWPEVGAAGFSVMQSGKVQMSHGGIDGCKAALLFGLPVPHRDPTAKRRKVVLALFFLLRSAARSRRSRMTPPQWASVSPLAKLRGGEDQDSGVKCTVPATSCMIV